MIRSLVYTLLAHVRQKSTHDSELKRALCTGLGISKWHDFIKDLELLL